MRCIYLDYHDFKPRHLLEGFDHVVVQVIGFVKL